MSFELNHEQQQAATTLDRDVVVTAGAGSGKTRMLSQRFINAVVPAQVDGWPPASVDEVVAITFTEKAAGELAERVRLALRDEGFVDEARRVDAGWISTIHGLCSRLLRRHAFEAGVDPLFEVADTVVAGRIRAEAFECAAVALVRSDGDVAALFDAYGYDRLFEATVSLARSLAVRGLTPDDIEVEQVLPAEALLDAAIELFSDGHMACGDYSGTAQSPAEFSAACSKLLERALELKDSGGEEQPTISALAAIVADYKPLRPVKGLEDVRDDGIERGIALRNNVGAALVAPLARGVVRLVGRFVAEFAMSKRKSGVLDFDDLQVEAVRLLTENRGIADMYRQRFRLVMIDEFQDTDSLQLKLVECLSTNDLCTVGDEKQSIYRFRGADIEVYRNHRREMNEREALSISLGINYRSHPGILSFVNAVFSSEEYFAGDLLRLTPPEGARHPQPLDEPLGDGPRVETLFVDSNGVDLATGRRAEARVIARRLSELRDRGIDPGDMVVLVRSYTNAHVYSDALSAEGLPALIVGGSRFFGLEEVAIMRALTRAIANPSDGSAIGELLASEFCPVSDDGLARLRLVQGGRDMRPLWHSLLEDGRELGGQDAEAASRLIDVIESARVGAAARPLADVLLQAVEDAGYDIRILARGSAGRDAFANVLKFARQAAAYEASVGTGAAAFSAHLDAQERYGDVEAPASVADDGSSAVRIMSVHASKGLEFPIVVVPDLASSGRGSSSIVRTGGAGSHLRMALTPPTADDGSKPPESSWAAEFAAAESQAGVEEGNRVLYVAFTRARDLLIASGSMDMRPKGVPKSNHHLRRLARLLSVTVPTQGTCDIQATLKDAGTGETASCRVRILDPASVLEEPEESERSPIPVACQPIPAPEARFEGDAPSISTPGQVSYSSLNRFAQCPRRFLVQDVLRLSSISIVEPGTVDPTRFGSAMHAVLQLMAGEGALPDTSRVEAVARQYELDADQLDRLRRGVERFAASETARRVVSQERVAREMPFALPIASGSSLLVGSIDVFARTGDSALIVDYKSGATGTLDELSRRYELQAKCYGLAALTAGCERVDVVFARPEVISADGDVQEVWYRFGARDRGSLGDEVDGLYARIAASSYEPLVAREESICGSCPAPVGLCPNARP